MLATRIVPEQELCYTCLLTDGRVPRILSESRSGPGVGSTRRLGR